MTNKKSTLKNSLIFLSILVVILDISVIAINYHSAQKALEQSLKEKAYSRRADFNAMTKMVYRNMLQMSVLLSHDERLNQLFLIGKRGVESGSPEGRTSAQQARLSLLGLLRPTWEDMTELFSVRQLHYHLGPGSMSFLRVHWPEKFGDRMDDLRYTVIDTNAERAGRTGFETGRVYSGLRGVSPVWANDPQTGQRTFVGALEVGTSFEQILPLFTSNYGPEAAVFLTKRHIDNKMWPGFVAEHFAGNHFEHYYLEAASSQESSAIVEQLFPLLNINDEIATTETQLIENGENNNYLTISFPLRDYQGDMDESLPASGFILLWEEVNDQIDAFHTAVWINTIYALITLFIVEVALLWFVRQEFNLQKVKQEAIVDGLTGAFNRRYFDKTIKHELLLMNRTQGSLSLIVCDVDYFKKYNDSYGHTEGDRCLKLVVEALTKSLSRDVDWLARYGGEEFAIVLPGTDLKGAAAVAERARSAVQALRLPHQGSDVSQWVTISVGVANATYSFDDQALFHRADQCLYRAKENGRNRVEVYAGSEPERTESDRAL
jgi:diguanylate cyclase (GGDEF)-like protein